MSLHNAPDQTLLDELSRIVLRLRSGETSSAQRVRDATTLDILAARYKAAIDLTQAYRPLLKALAGYPDEQELMEVEDTLNQHIDVLQTRP